MRGWTTHSIGSFHFPPTSFFPKSFLSLRFMIYLFFDFGFIKTIDDCVVSSYHMYCHQVEKILNMRDGDGTA